MPPKWTTPRYSGSRGPEEVQGIDPDRDGEPTTPAAGAVKRQTTHPGLVEQHGDSRGAIADDEVGGPIPVDITDEDRP